MWVVPAYVVFVLGSILLTVTDLDTKLIPNRILARVLVVGGFLLVVGGFASSHPAAVARAFGGGFVYFGIMFVLALIARGALGFGDVKLAALLGVFTGYLGWAQLTIAVLGAFLISGLRFKNIVIFSNSSLYCQKLLHGQAAGLNIVDYLVKFLNSPFKGTQ